MNVIHIALHLHRTNISDPDGSLQVFVCKWMPHMIKPKQVVKAVSFSSITYIVLRESCEFFVKYVEVVFSLEIVENMWL